MLALSRKKGEGIMIGEDIELVILDIMGEGVKIGINAPRNITIHRKEIFIQIREENEAALNSSNQNTEILKNLFK